MRMEKLMEDAERIVTAAGKNRRSLAALFLVIGVVAFMYLRMSIAVSQTVGTESVVMGQIQPNARIGDRSVVIGPTDTHGNVILNQPMIVGHNAHGGPGDLVIGADAGSASQTSKAEPSQNTPPSHTARPPPKLD